MTFDEWTPAYKQFCQAVGRKDTPEQARAYFGPLEKFSILVVREAVTIASSRAYDKFGHPNVSDLVDACVGVLRSKSVSAAVCDVCHGDKLTITTCEGWRVVEGKPVPVNRQALCKRDFPHARHDDAHFCWQCHPAARQSGEAA